MPSENNCTAVTCGNTHTSTSNLTAINTVTASQLLTSTTTGMNLWASGTSSINSYILNSGNVGIGTSTPNSSLIINNGSFRFPKDGEVRIDPETGESSIFFSDYNEWIDCDIIELKKTKDENGNKKTIVSVSFELSVARLKAKQNERKVLTEKYKEVKFTILSTGNVGLGFCNPNTPLTISGIYNTPIGVTGGYITTPYVDFYTETGNPYNNITAYNTNTITNNTNNLA